MIQKFRNEIPVVPCEPFAGAATTVNQKAF